MAALISIFVVLVSWRFLIVLGEVTFEQAGLPTEAARFESRSALTGSGYTTAQSELVTRNPAARRAASILVLSGYFGPSVVLALLGVSFVVPDDTDLSQRTTALVVVVLAFVVLDRTGVLRVLSVRPARAVSRRLVGDRAPETWLMVGDHVVATLSVPGDPARAEPVQVALRADDITVLGVEPAEPGPVAVPTPSQPAEPRPGDRVVVFGPQAVVEGLAAG